MSSERYFGYAAIRKAASDEGIIGHLVDRLERRLSFNSSSASTTVIPEPEVHSGLHTLEEIHKDLTLFPAIPHTEPVPQKDGADFEINNGYTVNPNYIAPPHLRFTTPEGKVHPPNGSSTPDHPYLTPNDKVEREQVKDYAKNVARHMQDAARVVVQVFYSDGSMITADVGVK